MDQNMLQGLNTHLNHKGALLLYIKKEADMLGRNVL